MMLTERVKDGSLCDRQQPSLLRHKNCIQAKTSSVTKTKVIWGHRVFVWGDRGGAEGQDPIDTGENDAEVGLGVGLANRATEAEESIKMGPMEAWGEKNIPGVNHIWEIGAELG